MSASIAAPIEGLEIEAAQDTSLVGQVADDAPQRLGQKLQQGRGRHDLVLLGEFRLLVDVDDLQVEAARQVLVADAVQVLDGALRARRRAGDEQPQQVAILATLRQWDRSLKA